MRKNLIITCLFGITAIILGAFAAHALKDKLDAEALNSFETAIRYQLYHVLVLLFINTYSGFSLKAKNSLSTIFFLGITFFSGSIYAIHLLGIKAKKIWFITPIGGLIFITGWVFMLVLFAKNAEKNK